MERLVRLVLGRRGEGKSYYIKKDTETANRILYYDTLSEYADSGVVFYDIDSLIEHWLKVYNKDFRIVYQPLQPQEEFDDICRLVFSCGDMVFVAEEIDTFCKQNYISLDFANVIQRGRHKNIDFYGVSQRPYGISRVISSQAKEIITFRQTEPRDIEYLKLFMGSEHIDKVQNLPQYHYLKWTSGGEIEIGKK